MSSNLSDAYPQFLGRVTGTYDVDALKIGLDGYVAKGVVRTTTNGKYKFYSVPDGFEPPLFWTEIRGMLQVNGPQTAAQLHGLSGCAVTEIQAGLDHFEQLGLVSHGDQGVYRIPEGAEA